MSIYVLQCRKGNETEEVELSYDSFRKIDWYCQRHRSAVRRIYSPPYIPSPLSFHDPYNGTYSTALGRYTANKADFDRECQEKQLTVTGTDESPSVRERRKQAFEEDGKRWPSV